MWNIKLSFHIQLDCCGGDGAEDYQNSVWWNSAKALSLSETPEVGIIGIFVLVKFEKKIEIVISKSFYFECTVEKSKFVNVSEFISLATGCKLFTLEVTEMPMIPSWGVW